MKALTFKHLGIASWLLDTLEVLNIRNPTEVQKSCIPAILKGDNVIGTAKTGSGKTAAFALPILQKLSEDPYGPFALVLTPTRELALQIGEQFRALGIGIRVREMVIVGGLDGIQQSVALAKRPHILVATPGRLADLLLSCSDILRLNLVRFLVLDEVDRLLDASFSKDLDVIFQALGHHPQRQTLLFSATLNASVTSLMETSLSQEYTGIPMFIYKEECELPVPDLLHQKYILVPSTVKEAYLLHLIQNQWKDKSLILFTNRCRICALLHVFLRKFQVRCIALHSFMTQKERMKALRLFKSSSLKVLLATDVGSRGLDVPKVELVVNYDVPSSETDYLHRVGRTARAGRSGTALSFVTEHDVQRLLHIEKCLGQSLEVFPLDENPIQEGEFLKQVHAMKKTALLHLEETGFGTKKELNLQKRKQIEQEQEQEEHKESESSETDDDSHEFIHAKPKLKKLKLAT